MSEQENEQICIDKAEYERLMELEERVKRALWRYDFDEEQRKGVGFPRGGVAWAMALDLRPEGPA